MDEWHIKALEAICGKELASTILETGRARTEEMEGTILMSRGADGAGLRECKYCGSKHAQGILRCTRCGASL